MAFILPVGLGLVAAVFLVVVSGELFYLFYWRKRPLAGPRLNNVTVAPVNEGETVETRDRGAVVLDVTCAEYQISTLQQDLVEKLFPSLSHSSTETTHTMVGPPRMLFTIKEETKEELEGLDMDAKARSRRSSRSKSMSDIPLSPITTTPFITPLSSPDVFSSPYGTPTFSPLFTLSCSHSASPVLKTSCRIMYDYAHSNPNPNPSSPPPPPAPPSPTRPTFSFLARNLPNGTATRASSGAAAGVNFVKAGSDANNLKAKAENGSPPRRPLFHHLAASPIHKQAECVVKAPSPLRTCTYEYDDSSTSATSTNTNTPSGSPQSWPDRSPNSYFTPSFEAIPAPAEILVAPSSKGSIFKRRQCNGTGNVFSPLSSPSDDNDPAHSPFASPLLVFPSPHAAAAAASEAPAFALLASSNEKSFLPTALRREGVMSPIVLPTQFSFHARSKAPSYHPPLVAANEAAL